MPRRPTLDHAYPHTVGHYGKDANHKTEKNNNNNGEQNKPRAPDDAAHRGVLFGRNDEWN